MTDLELADRFKNYGIYFYRGMDDAAPTAFTNEECEQIIAALRRWPERVVYQCPRCATSMEVDPTAKPSERPPSGEMVMVPREPTEAMLVAASYTGPNNTFLLWKDSAIIRIYRAMLSAAEAEGRKG